MKSWDEYQKIDITPVINSRLAVFPGDTAFSQTFALQTDKGDHLTLSEIRTTVHLGAHTDAPNHYARDAASIEQRSLDFYIGTAQVIQVPRQMGKRIGVADLAGKKIQAPRVLFKTLSFPNPSVWNNDFMSLSSELVQFLAEQGVRLVGIDTPSVDLADDKILESHTAIAKRDMAILEGVVLDHVEEGIYQLVALPLPLEGADASPVRAILVREKK